MARTGFTTRASCLFAAGCTALACGLVLGELTLVQVGLLCAALPWLAALAVERTRTRLRGRRTVPAGVVVAGDPVTVELAVANDSPLRTRSLLLAERLPNPVGGDARFVLPAVGAHQQRTLRYRLPGLPRGHHRLGPLSVRLGDPLGLIERTQSFTSVDVLTVVPVVEPITASAAFDGPRAGGGTPVGVAALGTPDVATREYRQGDDLRRIHWRSTARTGSLTVRLDEDSREGSTTVLLDLRRPRHASGASTEADPRRRDSLEWAVSAAASVGAHLLRAGRRVSLTTGADEPVELAGDPGRLLDHLAAVAAGAERPLQAAGDPHPLSAGGDRRGAEALIAVLARLDTADLQALLALGRVAAGGSGPAGSAIVLDVDSWAAGDAGGRRFVAARAAAAALHDAGWQVVLAGADTPVAQAWELLLGRRGRP